MIKEITLCKKEDIENRFLRNTAFKGMYVDPTTELVANAWTYDYDNHLFKVNVNNAMSSQIMIKEEKFNTGDVVEVEFEIYSENVVSSIIEWTFRDSANTVVLQDGYSITNEDLNKWKKCKVRFVANKKSSLELAIGALHHEPAKYMIKPIKITMNKLESSEASGLVTKRFAIKKEGGAWKINDSYSTDSLTFSNSGKALQCSLNPNPFLGNKKPHLQVTMGEKGNTYFVTVFGSYNNYFVLNIYSRADTSTSIDQAAVVDGTEVFITAIQ